MHQPGHNEADRHDSAYVQLAAKDSSIAHQVIMAAAAPRACRCHVRVQRYRPSGQAQSLQDFGTCDVTYDVDSKEVCIETLGDSKQLFLPVDGDASCEKRC